MPKQPLVPSLVLNSTAEHWIDSYPALPQGIPSPAKRPTQRNMRGGNKAGLKEQIWRQTDLGFCPNSATYLLYDLA